MYFHDNYFWVLTNFYYKNFYGLKHKLIYKNKWA